MAVVVDANLIVALATRDPRRTAVRAQFESWAENDEALHAPALLQYEVANALARLRALELIADDVIDDAWQVSSDVPITLHALKDGPGTIRLAQQLGRQNAYDAAYVALAMSLGVELWTLDGPLARNASGHGLPVQLIATSA
jgi:predicted nucleic acid-binding protein